MSEFESYASACKHRGHNTERCGLRVGSWPDDCREKICTAFHEYQRGKIDGLREGFEKGVNHVSELKLFATSTYAAGEAARRWPKEGDECK